MRRPLLLLVVSLALPLTAATDPEGDVAPCQGEGTADGAIDIVEARGEIVEQGMALRFTIVFADPPPVPDEEGQPLRVDVLLRDPDVPTVSFRYYRDLNRIVRFDAVPDPMLQVVLLPEQGANVFLGAVALGDTLTMTLPGRLITRDGDLEGLGLGGVTWNVIARDERACDMLGDGRVTRRLVAVPDAPPTDGTAPSLIGRETATGPSEGPDRVVLTLLVLALIGIGGVTRWVIRRRAEGTR